MTFRRRNYLINSSFQIKIIAIFIFISCIGGLVAVGTFNYFALRKLESLMWKTHINVESTGELIRPLFININIAGFIFISILLTIAAYLIFRRASEPLHRISDAINAAATGDLTGEISLRQKDEFNEVAHDLDHMLKNIRERYKAIHDQYRNVSKHLKEVNHETGTEDYDAILSEMSALEEALGRFKSTK